MVVAEGLEASSKGARVRFEGSKRDRDRRSLSRESSELKSLASGSGKLKSKDEAVQWLKSARPSRMARSKIRQLIEAEDSRWRSPEAKAAG
jgi:hypothetical protein